MDVQTLNNAQVFWWQLGWLGPSMKAISCTTFIYYLDLYFVYRHRLT